MEQQEKDLSGGLMELDLSQLTPLSPEVMSRQATINIGIIRRVAHEVPAIIKAISGVETVHCKNDLERLGTANAKIFKCEDDECPQPFCYSGYGSGETDPMCDVPGFENCRMKLIRHVSFVDFLSQPILKASMLPGTTVIDGAILLIEANQKVPQLYISEGLAALEFMGLKHIIILQLGTDLVQLDDARKQHAQIQRLTKGTIADGAPIIPFHADIKDSIKFVLEHIVNEIPIPKRDYISPPLVKVTDSFDLSEDWSEIDEIKGLFLAGSIKKGVLKVNQIIEIRPGDVEREEDSIIKCSPIYTTVASLIVNNNKLAFAVPGDDIGIETTMDPRLAYRVNFGQNLGLVGSLPSVYSELKVNFTLLRRLLGLREEAMVAQLTKGEFLRLTTGALRTHAYVTAVENQCVTLNLHNPVSICIGEEITISRRYGWQFRLIGYGTIQEGVAVYVDVSHCPI